MQNFTWEMSSYFADFPQLQVQEASTYHHQDCEAPINSFEPTGVSEGRQSFAPRPLDISMITEERTTSTLVMRESLAMSDVSVVGNLVQQIGPCSQHSARLRFSQFAHS